MLNSLTNDKRYHIGKMTLLEYFWVNGIFKEKKVSVGAIKDLMPIIATNIYEYFGARDAFYSLRKKANAKKKCIICESKISVLCYEGKSRHCIFCEEEFAKRSGLKRKVNSLKRKRRIRGTDDGTITAASLCRMLENQGYLCKYCDVDLNLVEKHLDHIYPLSKGGRHTLTNVQFLCAPCNLKKRAKVYNDTGN